MQFYSCCIFKYISASQYIFLEFRRPDFHICEYFYFGFAIACLRWYLWKHNTILFGAISRDECGRMQRHCFEKRDNEKNA